MSRKIPPPNGRRSRAFTLIELIVVLVILAILAAIAIPSFLGVITKSKYQVLLANAQAVYREAQADGMLGITASAPTSASLVAAASDAVDRASVPGHAGQVQPSSNGAVIWAQNGTDTSPGYIESYDSAWNMCVQLTVPSSDNSPTVGSCNTSDPGALNLMAVVDTNSNAVVGAVAPFVPNATSWTWSGLSGSASTLVVSTPYVNTTNVPTQVTVTTAKSTPVVVASAGNTPDPGASTVTVSATPTSVKLSWSLSQATASGNFSIYRCATAGCTPDLSPALATVASTASGYTDTSVSSGSKFWYQVAVPDQTGNTLVSNVVEVTVPTQSASGPQLSVLTSSSDLSYPTGIAVDSAGDLFFVNNGTDYIDELSATGARSIFGPIPGSFFTTPTFTYSAGLAVDSSGNIVTADLNNLSQLDRIAPGGATSVVAGTGTPGSPTPGPATSSALNEPFGVVFDSAGNLYIGDVNNHVVEKVTPSGTLSIIAGNGTQGAPTAGPATASALGTPTSLAIDSAGNLYIADSANALIEKVTPSGTLSIIAGTGTSGMAVPGPASSSPLNNPTGVAVDSSGNVYIADQNNHLVDKVTPAGSLSIVAGTGSVGTPSAGPASGSPLGAPEDVAVDSSGNLYITDVYYSEVLKVTNP